jgi:uncharacterized damage-inducible protein DinB
MPLLAEFEHEATTTRKHLARLPDDRLDWQPHPKSFTARALASHIVECIGWARTIFSADEFDFDPASYQPFRAETVVDLLREFDRNVEAGTRAISSAGAAAVNAAWRMKIRGRVRFERTRGDAFRDFTLSHVIHHRGQLSVYLRLLDVPVPGSYGPTADEQ